MSNRKPWVVYYFFGLGFDGGRAGRVAVVVVVNAIIRDTTSIAQGANWLGAITLQGI